MNKEREERKKKIPQDRETKENRSETTRRRTSVKI